MAASKTFSGRSAGSRAGLMVTAIIELTLAVVTLRTPGTQPAARVEGAQKMWALAGVVNTFGPIACFLFNCQKQLAFAVGHHANEPPADFPRVARSLRACLLAQQWEASSGKRPESGAP